METAITYLSGLGRRKEATAQVRLTLNGSGIIVINGRALTEYFPLALMQQAVVAPLAATGTASQFDVSVHVTGGGLRGQADSVRLGIARALVAYNPEFRSALKKQGWLSRDARVRERKKYGHRSARRSPQWSKR